MAFGFLKEFRRERTLEEEFLDVMLKNGEMTPSQASLEVKGTTTETARVVLAELYDSGDIGRYPLLPGMAEPRYTCR